MRRFLTFLGLGGIHALFSAALRTTASWGPLRRTRHPRLRIAGRPGQRLKPANEGGNWKGKEYLTYAEHDFCKRMAMKHGERAKGSHTPLYDRAVQVVFDARIEKRKAA